MAKERSSSPTSAPKPQQQTSTSESGVFAKGAFVPGDDGMVVNDAELFTGDRPPLEELTAPENYTGPEHQLAAGTDKLYTPGPRYTPKESGLPPVIIAEDDTFGDREQPTQPALRRIKEEQMNEKRIREQGIEEDFFAIGEDISQKNIEAGRNAPVANYTETEVPEPGLFTKALRAAADFLRDKITDTVRYVSDAEENLGFVQKERQQLDADLEYRKERIAASREGNKVWAHEEGSEVEQGFQAKMAGKIPGLGEEQIAVGELKRAFEGRVDFDEEMERLKLVNTINDKRVDEDGNFVVDHAKEIADRRKGRNSYLKELEAQEKQREDARDHYQEELQKQEAKRLEAREAYRNEKLAGVSEDFVDQTLMKVYDKKHPAMDIAARMREYDEQHPAVPIAERMREYDAETEVVKSGSAVERGFKAKTAGTIPGLKEDAAPEPMPEGAEHVTFERPSFWKRAATVAAFVASSIAAAVHLAPRLHSTDEVDMATAKAAEPPLKPEVVKSTSQTITSASHIPADAELNSPELESLRVEKIAYSKDVHQEALEAILENARSNNYVVTIESAQEFARKLKESAATTAQQEAADKTLDTLHAFEITQIGQQLQGTLNMDHNPLTSPLKNKPSVSPIPEVTPQQAMAEFRDLNRSYDEKAHEGYLVVPAEEQKEVEARLNPGSHAKRVLSERENTTHGPQL